MKREIRAETGGGVLTARRSPLSNPCLWVCRTPNLKHNTQDGSERRDERRLTCLPGGTSPGKSRRYRCLHSDESAVATRKWRQTADSRTTEVTSSRRRTLRSSSGGRAARPKATGRAMAGTETGVASYYRHTWSESHTRTRGGHQDGVLVRLFTFSGGGDQRVRHLVFEDSGQFAQLPEDGRRSLA